jgi:hypothetical protein
MSKTKPHQKNSRLPDTRTATHSRRVFWIGGVILLLLASGAYFGWQHHSNTETPETAHVASPPAQSSADILKTTIQRSYAVDRLFHHVINLEWEGASGAIGDAHLYAATHDARLLEFYSKTFPLINMHNGTWVDDRAWVCLAELYWWNVTGRMYSDWVNDAKRRYAEAKTEGRLSNHEGFWSWYNYSPLVKQQDFKIFTNTNMNQMATVACMLYQATHEIQFLKDALLVWEGDGTTPGVEAKFYRGDGIWKGTEGEAAFGKQFPWDGAGMCTIGAALYRATGKQKYRDIVVATASRIMDPANGWIDPTDYYQLRMDGNGAFVFFILDAYQIAPDQLSAVPVKIEKMLDHVWSNHHGRATLTLHRTTDDGIRNGWNPNGGEDGYKVDEIGTVHPQAQAVLAFGVFASVLKHQVTVR